MLGGAAVNPLAMGVVDPHRAERHLHRLVEAQHHALRRLGNLVAAARLRFFEHGVRACRRGQRESGKAGEEDGREPGVPSHQASPDSRSTSATPTADEGHQGSSRDDRSRE